MSIGVKLPFPQPTAKTKPRHLKIPLELGVIIFKAIKSLFPLGKVRRPLISPEHPVHYARMLVRAMLRKLPVPPVKNSSENPKKNKNHHYSNDYISHKFFPTKKVSLS